MSQFETDALAAILHRSPILEADAITLSAELFAQDMILQCPICHRAMVRKGYGIKSVKTFTCDGCHKEMRLTYGQKIAIFERQRQATDKRASPAWLGERTPDLTVGLAGAATYPTCAACSTANKPAARRFRWVAWWMTAGTVVSGSSAGGIERACWTLRRRKETRLRAAGDGRCIKF